MNIDITRLISGIDREIDVDITYSFDQEELKKHDILKLDDIKIQGIIKKDSLNNIVIDVFVKGNAVLPCSITLKPVDYPLNIEISGNLEEMFEEINEKSEKMQNSIDILPIIWENILMEIPMKVVSDEARNTTIEGDGWRLITDEKRETVNPEFQKLSELLKEK